MPYTSKMSTDSLPVSSKTEVVFNQFIQENFTIASYKEAQLNSQCGKLFLDGGFYKHCLTKLARIM